MNIGIIIGRIGGEDGVALETEKWITVLKRLNHKIFVISGEFQNWNLNSEEDTLVSEMSFFDPQCKLDQNDAFFESYEKPAGILEHIHDIADLITDKIKNWIRRNKIELIISENASALPAHLSMGLAIKNIAKYTGIKTITHDHDFAWERGNRYVSPYSEINDFIAETFPLRMPNSIHAVINTHAKNIIKEKFNRNAIVVPNVMDFDKEFGHESDKSAQLRTKLKLDKTDILLFQITRIVRRKGIETAIDLVKKLDDKRIKLIITGSNADDEGGVYFNELREHINRLKLNNHIVFATEIITHRAKLKGMDVNFSLSDAYWNANSCTYFSRYEGFGNAFVEAVMAKKPIFVNNYKPVYMPDIGSKGFKTVVVENNNLTDDAVQEMAQIIYNPKLNKEIADYNYNLGKKYFSYDTLQNKILKLIKAF